jgi:hypothetical protein
MASTKPELRITRCAIYTRQSVVRPGEEGATVLSLPDSGL